LPGHLLGVQLDRAIQEPGLRGEFDGLSLIKRGGPHDIPDLAQFLDRLA
jgi:hypothetical protein